MRSLLPTDGYFDPLAVRASIKMENYSEMPIRSIASIVKRIQRGFWRIIDDEPTRECFRIPESEYRRDERGDELEVGLLAKRTGEQKKIQTPVEIAEGRTHNDANKWRFHYGDELVRKLSPDVRAEHRDFLSACRTLNDRGRKMAYSLAVAFDALNSGTKKYPGSLAERVKGSQAYTRLLRYEDTKETQLVLFDHRCRPIHSQESDPRHVIMFTGTKFWAVTRGIYGGGTVHGVYSAHSREFDASLHRDRDCMTIHWISKCDEHGHRLAIVTFVHCMLEPEDVTWFDVHVGDLAIDPALYKL